MASGGSAYCLCIIAILTVNPFVAALNLISAL